METQELMEAILSGTYDSELNSIVNAVRQRRETKNAAIGLTLRPGDKVRFNSRIRPTYLIGKVGTVDRVNRKTVSIAPNPEFGRFKHGMRCPLGYIEGKVEAHA